MNDGTRKSKMLQIHASAFSVGSGESEFGTRKCRSSGSVGQEKSHDGIALKYQSLYYCPSCMPERVEFRNRIETQSIFFLDHAQYLFT